MFVKIKHYNDGTQVEIVGRFVIWWAGRRLHIGSNRRSFRSCMLHTTDRCLG